MDEITTILNQVRALKQKHEPQRCIQLLETNIQSFVEAGSDPFLLVAELVPLLLDNARAFQRVGGGGAENFLNKARLHTNPIPQFRWTTKVEWKLLRLEVLKEQAEFFGNYEDEIKVWKAYAQLVDSLPPDQAAKVRPANLELTIAIAYTRAENYLDADTYATQALANIEQQINKNKGLAFANLSKTNAAAAELVMTSYCLTLHHLGSIKAKLGDLDRGIELLTKAKVLAPKYVKEKEVRLAISAKLKACEDAAAGATRVRKPPSRKTTVVPQQVQPAKTQKRGISMPSADLLVEEILAEENKSKRRKSSKKDVGLKTLPTLPAVNPSFTSQKQFLTLDMPQIQSSSSSLVSEPSEVDISRSSRSRITLKTPRSQQTSQDESKEDAKVGERTLMRALQEEAKRRESPPKPLISKLTAPVKTEEAVAKPAEPKQAPPVNSQPQQKKTELPQAVQSVSKAPQGKEPPRSQPEPPKKPEAPRLPTVESESSEEPQPAQSKMQISKEMQRLRDLESKAAETIQKYAKRYITKRKQSVPPSRQSDDKPLLSDMHSDDSLDMDLVIPSKDLFPMSQDSKGKLASSGAKDETTKISELESNRAKNPPTFRTIPLRLSHKEPPILNQDLKKTEKPMGLLQLSELENSDIAESRKKPEPFQAYRKVRKRASPKDYLELSAPEIHMRRRLHPENFPYTWRLVLREITCNRTVTFHLECYGEGLSFADNIYCELPVEVDLDQLSDYRIMHPFEYQTIWPVVASSLETMNWESEEGTGRFQSGNESALGLSTSFQDDEFDHDEAASNRIQLTLENILDKYQFIDKVTGKVLGPLSPQMEESSETEEDQELPDLRDFRDGIFKQMVYLVMHKKEEMGELAPIGVNVDIPVSEKIFERGIAKMELGYFFLVLTMTSDFSVLQEGFQTNYRSYVLLELNSTTSDWREVIPISWENIELFYQSLDYKLPLGYILRHGKLPGLARNLLYRHLPSILEIRQSSIAVDFSHLRQGPQTDCDVLSDEELFATSTIKPVIVTDVNWIEKEESVNWDLVLPGSIYSSAFNVEDYTRKLQEGEAVLILNRTNLTGGKDMLHIKLSFTHSKKLAIEAWNMRTEDCYRFIQNQEEVIKFLVRLCEENAICGRLILQSTLKLERTMHGTMLVAKETSHREPDLLRELVYHRLSFLNREIRTVSNTLSIVCFYASDRGMRLEIYDYTSCKVHLIALGETDFEEHFRTLSQLVPGIKKMLLKRESIHAPVSQAIREFFYPLAQNLMFERALTGVRLVWKSDEMRRKDDALRLKNAKLGSKQFKFLEKNQLTINRTLKMRPLADSIVNSMLGYEADGLLVRSNNEFQVVLQRTKIVKGRLGLLSVLRHTLIEEWRVHLYFPSTCRSFQSRLYDSDLYSISAEALDVNYPDPTHIVNSVRPASKAWELILSQCSFEEMRGILFFQFDNISSPMTEVVYSAIIEKNYSANETSGVLYAEVVLKSSADTVGPFEEFPVLHDLREARTKMMMSIRAYSFSKRIWVKQNLSLDEGVRLLLREQKLEQTILVQPRFVFSFVKELSNLLFKVVKLKAKMRTTSKDQTLPDITAIARSRDESLDPMVGKDDWRNIDESITEKEERLHLTIVHSIPVTLGGAFLNVYRDEFVIRVYRPGTGESYKKVVRRKEMRNLLTEVDFLLEKGMYKSLGIRIIQLLLPRVLSKISLST